MFRVDPKPGDVDMTQIRARIAVSLVRAPVPDQPHAAPPSSGPPTSALLQGLRS